MGSLRTVGLCTLACASALSAQDTTILARVAVESLTITRPAVIGYFPPITQAEVDTSEGWASALSHVEFALDDARHCLPADSVDVRLVFATTLVLIRPGVAPQVLRLNTGDSILGAILVAPDRPLQRLYPRVGPSALIPMLGQAAAAFFRKPECDPFRD